MSKSRFSVGDKVICIAEDGYHSDKYFIGSIWTVFQISNEGRESECISFVETNGIGGPYSRKFAPYTFHYKMDPEFDLDEINLAEELVKG